MIWGLHLFNCHVHDNVLACCFYQYYQTEHQGQWASCFHLLTLLDMMTQLWKDVSSCLAKSEDGKKLVKWLEEPVFLHFLAKTDYDSGQNIYSGPCDLRPLHLTIASILRPASSDTIPYIFNIYILPF